MIDVMDLAVGSLIRVDGHDLLVDAISALEPLVAVTTHDPHGTWIGGADRLFIMEAGDLVELVRLPVGR